MIPGNITTQVPYVNSLAVIPFELLESFMRFLNTGTFPDAWLTKFEVIGLVVLALLVSYVIAKHKHCEHRLKEQIAELTTTNENLQQEIAQLNGEEIELLEEILDADPPKKEIPGFNPQELKALSELAKRLR